MKSLVFIIVPLLFFSCINEDQLKTNFPIQYLHGNSAKVWILFSSSLPDDKNIKAMKQYRKSFIFYHNNSFREQELIHLGSNKGFYGKYQIDRIGKGKIKLSLYYTGKKNNYFIIEDISNNQLSLKNTLGNQATWKLKSLNPPEL